MTDIPEDRMLEFVTLSCVVATRVPEICLAPDCECYEKHGKPTVKAITDALTIPDLRALAGPEWAVVQREPTDGMWGADGVARGEWQAMLAKAEEETETVGDRGMICIPIVTFEDEEESDADAG